ncbi:unnamed protein product [Amoebophrya sp. A120]|nr:unnamed protein product [Amoebophrya sp. A120]|eukprot:GSA120T00021098001.1
MSGDIFDLSIIPPRSSSAAPGGGHSSYSSRTSPTSSPSSSTAVDDDEKVSTTSRTIYRGREDVENETVKNFEATTSEMTSRRTSTRNCTSSTLFTPQSSCKNSSSAAQAPPPALRSHVKMPSGGWGWRWWSQSQSQSPCACGKSSASSRGGHCGKSSASSRGGHLVSHDVPLGGGGARGPRPLTTACSTSSTGVCSSTCSTRGTARRRHKKPVPTSTTTANCSCTSTWDTDRSRGQEQSERRSLFSRPSSSPRPLRALTGAPFRTDGRAADEPRTYGVVLPGRGSRTKKTTRGAGGDKSSTTSSSKILNRRRRSEDRLQRSHLPPHLTLHSTTSCTRTVQYLPVFKSIAVIHLAVLVNIMVLLLLYFLVLPHFYLIRTAMAFVDFNFGEIGDHLDSAQFDQHFGDADLPDGAFDHFDIDNDGTVDPSEMDYWDADHDNTISADEWEHVSTDPDYEGGTWDGYHDAGGEMTHEEWNEAAGDDGHLSYTEAYNHYPDEAADADWGEDGWNYEEYHDHAQSGDLGDWEKEHELSEADFNQHLGEDKHMDQHEWAEAHGYEHESNPEHLHPPTEAADADAEAEAEHRGGEATQDEAAEAGETGADEEREAEHDDEDANAADKAGTETEERTAGQDGNPEEGEDAKAEQEEAAEKEGKEEEEAEEAEEATTTTTEAPVTYEEYQKKAEKEHDVDVNEYNEQKEALAEEGDYEHYKETWENEPGHDADDHPVSEEQFNALAEDHEGKLAPEDVDAAQESSAKTAFLVIDQELSHEQVKLLDADGDGSISEAEVAAAEDDDKGPIDAERARELEEAIPDALESPPAPEEPLTEEQFNEVGEELGDKDGVLTQDELDHATHEVEIPADQEDTLGKLDTDHDGKISQADIALTNDLGGDEKTKALDSVDKLIASEDGGGILEELQAHKREIGAAAGAAALVGAAGLAATRGGKKKDQKKEGEGESGKKQADQEASPETTEREDEKPATEQQETSPETTEKEGEKPATEQQETSPEGSEEKEEEATTSAEKQAEDDREQAEAGGGEAVEEGSAEGGKGDEETTGAEGKEAEEEAAPEGKEGQHDEDAEEEQGEQPEEEHAEASKAEQGAPAAEEAGEGEESAEEQEPEEAAAGGAPADEAEPKEDEEPPAPAEKEEASEAEEEEPEQDEGLQPQPPAQELEPQEDEEETAPEVNAAEVARAQRMEEQARLAAEQEEQAREKENQRQKREKEKEKEIRRAEKEKQAALKAAKKARERAKKAQEAEQQRKKDKREAEEREELRQKVMAEIKQYQKEEEIRQRLSKQMQYKLKKRLEQAEKDKKAGKRNDLTTEIRQEMKRKAKSDEFTKIVEKPPRAWTAAKPSLTTESDAPDDLDYVMQSTTYRTYSREVWEKQTGMKVRTKVEDVARSRAKLTSKQRSSRGAASSKSSSSSSSSAAASSTVELVDEPIMFYTLEDKDHDGERDENKSLEEGDDQVHDQEHRPKQMITTQRQQERRKTSLRGAARTNKGAQQESRSKAASKRKTVPAEMKEDQHAGTTTATRVKNKKSGHEINQHQKLQETRGPLAVVQHHDVEDDGNDTRVSSRRNKSAFRRRSSRFKISTSDLANWFGRDNARGKKMKNGRHGRNDKGRLDSGDEMNSRSTATTNLSAAPAEELYYNFVTMICLLTTVLVLGFIYFRRRKKPIQVGERAEDHRLFHHGTRTTATSRKRTRSKGRRYSGRVIIPPGSSYDEPYDESTYEEETSESNTNNMSGLSKRKKQQQMNCSSTTRNPMKSTNAKGSSFVKKGKEWAYDSEDSDSGEEVPESTNSHYANV